MRLNVPFAVVAMAVTAMLPLDSASQDAENQGYLLDPYGEIVTSSLTGLCWRDSDWTPARAVERCDPMDITVAYAPAMTPATMAQPPVIAAAVDLPAKPVPERVSFSADALFAFDTSALTAEGKALLDKFLNQLSGVTYESISATGHADRFGSPEYNQRLSERRSNTAKAYLMSKQIPASRIVAHGRGDTQAVTRPGDCTGARSAKVIACLQPDRRVDIQMTGTKAGLTTR